jgi:5,5'-dehydrodivanillate O-demethylase
LPFKTTHVLTAEENTQLTRVGPGTPMGNLLRRYWHPIAAETQMRDRWTMRVRILGEDLVLFKDRTGRFGLIGEFCPHRRASLAYGIPTEDGIHCPYHGWKFDGAGHCLEQPNEPAGSNFKDKVSLAGYPVQSLAGFLWAYLGPAPAPLIPRYDGLVAEGLIRQIGYAELPCNWLQIMENGLDPVHAEWLHGALYQFLKEGSGEKVAFAKHHTKIGFDEFAHGIIQRRLLAGQPDDASDWTDGHPGVLFPNILSVPSGGGLFKKYVFQIRVPIDDERTQHFWFHGFMPPPDADVPAHLLDEIPGYEVPFLDRNGEYMMEFTHAADIMAWITQGRIADRTTESLGTTDRGITMYRKMLVREMRKSERGEDPMNVLRDPEQNAYLDLPAERNKDGYSDGFASLFLRHMSRFSPVADDILDVFSGKYSRTSDRVT